MSGPHARYPRTPAPDPAAEPPAKTAVNNSPTLIGAAFGTLGGPLWALLGTGAANALAGFPDTAWGTLNVSAAMLLIVVNGALLVMSLAVASRCASLGSPAPQEFAAALLVSTPYVIYRAFSPCRPPTAALDLTALAGAIAPAALVRIAGGSGGGALLPSPLAFS